MGFRNPVLIMTLILIVIVLFGFKRLPDVASAIGQSLKILKKDVKELRNDDPKPTQDTPAAADGAAPTTPDGAGATFAGPPGQSAPLPTPQPDPQREPTTPATPDVVEGDDSKA